MSVRNNFSHANLGSNYTVNYTQAGRIYNFVKNNPQPHINSDSDEKYKNLLRTYYDTSQSTVINIKCTSKTDGVFDIDIDQILDETSIQVIIVNAISVSNDNIGTTVQLPDDIIQNVDYKRHVGFIRIYLDLDKITTVDYGTINFIFNLVGKVKTTNHIYTYKFHHFANSNSTLG
jgi:hypothetical protein